MEVTGQNAFASVRAPPSGEDTQFFGMGGLCAILYITRVGNRLYFIDSDSCYRFLYLTILDSDSERGKKTKEIFHFQMPLHRQILFIQSQSNKKRATAQVNANNETK